MWWWWLLLRRWWCVVVVVAEEALARQRALQWEWKLGGRAGRHHAHTWAARCRHQIAEANHGSQQGPAGAAAAGPAAQRQERQLCKPDFAANVGGCCVSGLVRHTLQPVAPTKGEGPSHRPVAGCLRHQHRQRQPLQQASKPETPCAGHPLAGCALPAVRGTHMAHPRTRGMPSRRVFLSHHVHHSSAAWQNTLWWCQQAANALHVCEY